VYATNIGLVLIGPGVAATLIGSFVRLSGVGYRKWLLAIAGGLSGAWAAGLKKI